MISFQEIGLNISPFRTCHRSPCLMSSIYLWCFLKHWKHSFTTPATDDDRGRVAPSTLSSKLSCSLYVLWTMFPQGNIWHRFPRLLLACQTSCYFWFCQWWKSASFKNSYFKICPGYIQYWISNSKDHLKLKTNKQKKFFSCGSRSKTLWLVSDKWGLTAGTEEPLC